MKHTKVKGRKGINRTLAVKTPSFMSHETASNTTKN